MYCTHHIFNTYRGEHRKNVKKNTKSEKRSELLDLIFLTDYFLGDIDTNKTTNYIYKIKTKKILKI